jgi:hypothetical protein
MCHRRLPLTPRAARVSDGGGICSAHRQQWDSAADAADPAERSMRSVPLALDAEFLPGHPPERRPETACAALSGWLHHSGGAGGWILDDLDACWYAALHLFDMRDEADRPACIAKPMKHAHGHIKGF